LAEESKKRNRPLEAAAKAMFEAQLSSEVASTSEFKIDRSKFSVFQQTGRTTDVFKITISGWALVSFYLCAALEAHAEFESRTQQQEIFGPMGPLGTDSGRLRIARSFGWIPKEQQSLLDTIRKKRNLIAHEVSDGSSINFDAIFSGNYADLLKTRIDHVVAAYSDAVSQDGGNFERTSEYEVSAIFTMLAFDTFEWVFWGRSRDRLRMTDTKTPIFFPDGTEPNWHREFVLSMVTAIVSLSSRKPVVV
jgi:hypothetical protein